MTLNVPLLRSIVTFIKYSPGGLMIGVVVSPIPSPSTKATRTSDGEALVDQASDLVDEGTLEEATSVPDLVIEEGGDAEGQISGHS
jgi:hypothetical protein